VARRHSLTRVIDGMCGFGEGRCWEQGVAGAGTRNRPGKHSRNPPGKEIAMSLGKVNDTPRIR